MFFQFATTKRASKIRLVRPGPVTKLVAIVFRSMCSSETPATPAAPTPSGRRKPNAFADAMSTAALRLDVDVYLRVSMITIPCEEETAYMCQRAG